MSETYEIDKSLIDDPTVSLIVPMYNVREDVAECIESILAQTLNSTQVILIDDGSTDDTGDIASSYALSNPNVEYHRIVNEGLGHARNYGVQFARGKWFMFPDSDDVLEDFALSELVALGEKHGCDMVLGDVVRFNTKGSFDSGLHRRAFRFMDEVTHITKNHDLLYDTTAWNKLYRRDFYLREGFKWVEGRLYEDIPVTTPAHFMANKVAFLDKVIYKWRVRDGQGASITQKRTEIKNFRDRFYAVTAVDEFFDKNVTDHDLIVDKDFKWLSLDLMLYIDVLGLADDSFQAEVMRTVGEYLGRVSPEAFTRLRAIDRIKYQCVRNGDLRQLLAVSKYAKEGIDTLRLVRRGGRIIGRFPFKGLDDSTCDMTDELREFGLWTKVDSVALGDGCIDVECSAVIRPLSQKRVSLSAHLVNAEGERGAELVVHGLPAKRKWEVQNNKDFGTLLLKRQPLRDFRLSLPESVIGEIEPGSYRIELDYSDGELICDPMFLRGPVVGAKPRPLPSVMAGKLVSVSYNANWQLIISVSSDYRMLSGAFLVEDKRMRLEFADGASDDVDLSAGNAVLAGDIPTIVSIPVFIPCVSEDDKSWRVSSDAEPRARVDLVPSGCVARIVEDLPDGAGFRVEIERANAFGAEPLALVFTGQRFGASSEVPLHEGREGDGSWSATVDLTDHGIVDVLRDDNYALGVRLRTADGSEVDVALYAPYSGNHDIGNYDVDGYSYSLDCFDGIFRLIVQHDKLFYEGRLREQIAERVVYPLMRLLPLKKNLVVFESYWGRSIGCNPKAFYDYLQECHPEYECVWSVADLRIPLDGLGRKVISGKLPYFYAMARAKYLVNNVNFLDAYEKRRGQLEIQTMHGTPLKTLGLDVKSDFPTEESVTSFKRRCGRWDYLIVQSPKVEEITKSCYLFDRTFLRTGYPRNDELLRRGDAETQRQLKERLGVDPDKKLVLYVPTWRASGRFDLELDFTKLERELGDGYAFALRRHHLALPGFTRRELMGNALDFTHEKSIDDVLLASDIVITDYSSIMFDYALLDRPMLFFAYDLEQYRDDLRGFNIDLESEAPGPILKTTDEVIEAIRACGDGLGAYEEMHRRFKDTFLPYETGHASEAVFNEVFKRG